jgi:flagellar protein FliS
MMEDQNRTGHETARRYAAAEMTGIDRERLLMLLLDGGGRFLRVARESLAAGDVAAIGHALTRAQAIIAELQGTLDHQAGGEIAGSLHRLYDFMLFHLTEANGQGSVRHLDEVIVTYDTVVDAFRQILEPGRPSIDG